MMDVRHWEDLRAGAIAAVCAVAAIAGCGSSAGGGPGPGNAGRLEPPSNVHTEPAAPLHCVLAWTPPAQPVDGYEIATSLAGWIFADATPGSVAPGTATRAELDFSHTSAHELTQVSVQIRSLGRTEVSAFAPAATCVMPPVPPDVVFALIQPGGIAVNGRNNSVFATMFEIERATLDAAGAPGPWAPIATMSQQPQEASLQTYIDAAVAAGAAYGYRISAITPGGQRSLSSKVATTMVLGAPLTASTVMLPPSDVTVTDGKGHYAAFRGRFAGPLQITWGDGATWTQSPAIAAQPYEPFVRLDAAGLPHTVYGKPAGQFSDVVITHGWSDGTQWHEEPVAQRALNSIGGNPVLVFDLDATGTPVITWSLLDGFEAATRVAGSWTVQSLDSLIPSQSLGQSTVFVDASGVPHLVVATVAGLRYLPFSGGAWTSEPVSGISPIGLGPLIGAGRDTEHLAVCFDYPGAIGLTIQPVCVRRTPAGWGEAELLGLLPSGFNDTQAMIAMSADGRRLAVLEQILRTNSSSPSGNGTYVFRFEDGGGWSEIASPALSAPGQIEATPFLGFDATGKLFTLADPTAATDGSSTTVAYRLSREP